MKNEKLTKMLEKSNRLYTSLLEQNQQLSIDLKRAQNSQSKPVLSIFNDNEIFIKPESHQNKNVPINSKIVVASPPPSSSSSSSNQTPKSKKSYPPPSAAMSAGPGQIDPLQDDKKLNETYLKRVLLQFFLQNDSKRDQLVPLILELAGCNETQIAAATRQYQRTTQKSANKSFFNF